MMDQASFRRLLKNVATDLYYDGKGGWTPNHAEAYAFPDSMSAVAKAVELGPETLHLVLKFVDGRLDVSHSLAGEPSRFRNPGQALVLMGILPAVLAAEKIAV